MAADDTRQVIDETLRLVSFSPFVCREALKDVKLGGISTYSKIFIGKCIDFKHFGLTTYIAQIISSQKDGRYLLGLELCIMILMYT